MFASVKGKQQKQVRHLRYQKQCIDHIPHYISGLSRARFSDNLSRNSCILVTGMHCYMYTQDDYIFGYRNSLFFNRRRSYEMKNIRP